jgi:oligopeptide/dipeptide ABC transporter ATP-binding protein
MKNILEIEDLKVHFAMGKSTLKAVDGVTYDIGEGRSIGIIGESGSGKSVTARAAMRILSKPGYIAGGDIRLRVPSSMTDGMMPRQSGGYDQESGMLELSSLSDRGPLIRSIRGKVVSMIFQEPMTSLSPVHTIGNQIMEAVLLHRTSDKVDAREIALDMLDRVHISNPSQRIDEYPHQLSGGMRQRAMIAMALSCNPSLLIADEPTTALDVTVQAQIITLLKELQGEFGMAIQYITHDLGVIAEVAEDVAVMYLGRIVESGSARQVLKNPQHPYTKGLMASIPRLGKKSNKRLSAIPGNVPIPLDPPHQCGFFSRCEVALAGKCNADIPALTEVEPGHKVRCFLHSEKAEPNPNDTRSAA